MSIALLKTLIAVADHGSFSAAAEAGNLTQAAVGQQMKRLEHSLHVTLFERSRKSPQLNPVARALVPKARDLVQRYDTLMDDISGDGQLHGELVLGAVPSSISALVPLSIKALIRIYPQLHFRVVPGLSSDLQEQLERGAVDAAILSEPENLAEHMRWHPFVVEELVLLTSPELAIVSIPKAVLVPTVGFMTIIGTFAIRNSVSDVVIMIVLGVFGWVVSRFGFAASPIVLGLILGPIAEQGFVQTWIIGSATDNLPGMFFGRPISQAIVAFTVLSLLYPVIAARRKKREAQVGST